MKLRSDMGEKLFGHNMNFSFEEFDIEYQSVVDAVLVFFDRDAMALVSKHNVGWHPDNTDIENYLRTSSKRFWEAFKLLQSNGVETGRSVLDVGGFFGTWALILKKLGYKPTIAERYDYYYGAFDKLIAYLRSEGVGIVNQDFSDPEIELGTAFDAVTCMAVLEHIPGAPISLLTNINKAVSDNGFVVLEVPNIAFWPKRFDLLKGKSSHPPMDFLFKSAQPFCGHYREYSMEDLRYVNNVHGWELLDLNSFNYTGWPKGNWKQKIFLEMPTEKFSSCREVLISIAKKP